MTTVLVNGTRDCSAIWDRVAEQLAEAGHVEQIGQ